MIYKLIAIINRTNPITSSQETIFFNFFWVLQNFWNPIFLQIFIEVFGKVQEKKIPHIIDGNVVYLTPSEHLEWTKYEEEKRNAEKERQERKAERERQEEARRQREAEQETQKDLVDWVIGEGSTARTIMVRPETVPFLIQAQSKKDDKPHEVKEKFHEELKEQQNQW